MFTADVVGLYLSTAHDVGMEALKRTVDDRINKKNGTKGLIKWTEFVLKIKYCEFNGKVKQQLSGTAIGTKFVPSFACILIDQVKTEFLESQVYKPLVWFRPIDDIFFI